jgi:hypothetical protein
VSSPGFVATVIALPSIMSEAPSPTTAWALIRRQMDESWEMSSTFPEIRIEAEVAAVTNQLRAIFDESPPPADLQFLYFGLFAAADETTFEERAGYYVSGTTRSIRVVEANSDLSGHVLDYSPHNMYLESSLLEQIKASALSSEADYNSYDYGLMLCAASVLSFYAARNTGMDCPIVVGFDSGDAVQFPARTSNTR